MQLPCFYLGWTYGSVNTSLREITRVYNYVYTVSTISSLADGKLERRFLSNVSNRNGPGRVEVNDTDIF